MDLSSFHILEIGDHTHFKRTFFERTTLLWTGGQRPKTFRQHDYADCTPRAFAPAMREVAAGKFDIVIAYAGQRPPWHPRYWARAMFGRAPLSAAIRVVGVRWRRYMQLQTPLAVLDMHDISKIHRSSFFLLDITRLYFKRELPVDYWRNPRWQYRIAKLRPISLPVGAIDLDRYETEVFSSKTADIFFAGAVDGNSTVRERGLRQLQKLADQGLKIDIATERLSQAEFYQRISRVWPAWSPPGLGWDCYRHYEAPQCLAVPAINYQTIARCRPLEDGIHAIHYSPEDDGLDRAIKIACAGRAHLCACHTGSAFCEDVLRSVS